MRKNKLAIYTALAVLSSAWFTGVAGADFSAAAKAGAAQLEHSDTSTVSDGSTGTAIGGEYNVLKGLGTVITGGERNQIATDANKDSVFIGGAYNKMGPGEGSAGVGGAYNYIEGNRGVIIGGDHNNGIESDGTSTYKGYNHVMGNDAVIIGGHLNYAPGERSVNVSGWNNEVSGTAAATVSGSGNRATGNYSAVLGGDNGLSSAQQAVAVSGQNNVASGTASLVAGGGFNKATAAQSVIAGGANNTASGLWSSVLGGEHNTATSSDPADTSKGFSTVTGGSYNTASGNDSLAAGGDHNETTAAGLNAVVSGGSYNQASAAYSAVYGGYKNSSSGQWSGAFGGMENKAAGQAAVAAGGSENEASANSASVFGGTVNKASGDLSSVVGGADNEAAAVKSAIVGGYQNKTTASDDSTGWSTVFGGGENESSGSLSSIVGGEENRSSGYASLVLGGTTSLASGSYSVTMGGENSMAMGYGSTAIGGGQAFGDYSMAIGLEAVASRDDDGYTISFGHKAGDTYYAGVEDALKGEKSTYGDATYNRLINVADGINAHDAAVVEQLHTISSEDGSVIIGEPTKDPTNGIKNYDLSVRNFPVSIYNAGSMTGGNYTGGKKVSSDSFGIQNIRLAFGDGLKAESGMADGKELIYVSLDKDSLADDDRFKGPEGKQGPEGPQGPKGEPGRDGMGSTGGSVYLAGDGKTEIVKIGDKAYHLSDINADGTVKANAKPLTDRSIGHVKKEVLVGWDRSAKDPVGLTNLSDGKITESSKDAVNGSQLYDLEGKMDGQMKGMDERVTGNRKRIDELSGQVGANTARINDLQNESRRGDALNAALAALHPLDFDADAKWDFSAGYGNYHGSDAMAVGAFYRPDEDLMLSIGGAMSGSEHMMNAGVSVKLGSRSNHVSHIRISTAKELKELREKVASQEKDIEEMKVLISHLTGNPSSLSSAEEVFPDVPENHWAYEYVSALQEAGIIKGYPDGYFRGNHMMTRYEMAAVTYRLIADGLVNRQGLGHDDRLNRLAREFASEMKYIRVDVIRKDAKGNPVIERVRVIKEK